MAIWNLEGFWPYQQWWRWLQNHHCLQFEVSCSSPPKVWSDHFSLGHPTGLDPFGLPSQISLMISLSLLRMCPVHLNLLLFIFPVISGSLYNTLNSLFLSDSRFTTVPHGAKYFPHYSIFKYYWFLFCVRWYNPVQQYWLQYSFLYSYL